MKIKTFFIGNLILLIFNARVSAQSVPHTQAEMNKLLQSMMTDKADSWDYNGAFLTGKYAAKFNVWVRSHSSDNMHRYMVTTFDGEQYAAQLYNAVELELATTTITPQNAYQYIYRVTANNGTELMPWTTPSVFRSNKFTSYAYFGKFDCRNKELTLTIAEKNNKVKASVYIYKNYEIPVVKISKLFVQYHNGLSAMSTSDWNKGFGISTINNVERLNLSIVNTSKNELYHIYLKRQTADEKDTTLAIGNNWEHNLSSSDPVAYINSSFFQTPGKYTIIIKPEIAAGTQNKILVGTEASAHFTVLPGPKTIPLKTVEWIILIILTTAGVVFMEYRACQKRKLARQAKDRQIATLQLQAVRAQLNPHFMFNALAGIQNLMNKNEVENANKYLSRFARLTRNVLDDSNKELTTIEHETGLLRDYLEMEQMRFGFQFSIDVDALEIDQQIEIPAMLLQPFAENAVKHGVSAMKEAGMVKVSVAKKGDSLLLSVQDNGKGFGSGQSTGMGIKLCEERISLLNSIHKNTSILLHKTSDSKGTVITIELKNWV